MTVNKSLKRNNTLYRSKSPRRAYRKRKAAWVRIADYLKLALPCKCNPQITNVIYLVLFSKIFTEHERDNSTVSCEDSVKGHETESGAESLPWVQGQPHRQGLAAKMLLCNFELKVVRKASFYY